MSDGLVRPTRTVIRSGAMRGPKVTVLLSTYNGESYLSEQLTSLVKQDWANLQILVRDDGSTDRTLDILRGFEERFGEVSVVRGENVGAAESFLHLLRMSDDSDFYAFCDQDDYWQPDKVSRAVAHLGAKDVSVPSLYGSAFTVVDENLKSHSDTTGAEIRPSFPNALLENVIAGCTMVFNQAAKNALCRDSPRGVLMHDWWVYQVVSAIGEVVYDSESRILYRQHSSNAVGINRTQFDKWRRRLRRMAERRSVSLAGHHARELKRIYGAELSKDVAGILSRFVEGRGSLPGRIRYAVNGEAYRHRGLDNLVFRILIILDKI